jgi:hypothetical protein
MPGTQPFQGGSEFATPQSCATCHGDYSPAVEPYRNWQGSMMAHAGRDPLFEANMAIANQDAPDSGDLCLRCHKSNGWLQGRSVPTDGSRMIQDDRHGVSCELCHRMVDPVFKPGVNPAVDTNILAALTFPGTNYGNGMYVIDPTSTTRGPFTNAAAPHAFVASSFHRSSAFCGTCHDVSNPAVGDLALHDMTGGNYWMPDVIKYQNAQNTLRLGGGLTTVQLDALDAGKLQFRGGVAAGTLTYKDSGPDQPGELHLRGDGLERLQRQRRV